MIRDYTKDSAFRRSPLSKVGANAQLESVKSYSFIDENGGGPGVRLRKRQQKKG
jgi:hypothetical protein